MIESVLVTGAGGFVGSHLAEGLAALGKTVTGLDTEFDAPTRARLAGVELIEARLTVGALEALPRFDLVIHGAALTTPANEMGLTAAAHTQINIDLILTSLDFAIRKKSAAFVFLSSSGVFSGSAAKRLLESTPVASREPYGLAKRAGELLLQLAPAGLRAIAVRLGPVYGLHERARATRHHVSLVRQWLDAAATQQAIVVASPLSVRDWTFAGDLAFAVDALLGKTDIEGVVHLCAPDVVSDEALARQVGAMTQTPVLIELTGETPRRPMSSERLDLSRLIDWTPLPVGLAQTLSMDLAA